MGDKIPKHNYVINATALSQRIYHLKTGTGVEIGHEENEEVSQAKAKRKFLGDDYLLKTLCHQILPLFILQKPAQNLIPVVPLAFLTRVHQKGSTVSSS